MAAVRRCSGTTAKTPAFSTAKETYLPVLCDETYGYKQVNVTAQEDDPDSYLNLTRFLIRTRRSQPALRNGAFEFVETESKEVLAFRRFVNGKDGILCAFNLSDQSQTFTLKHERMDLLSRSKSPMNGIITLAPYSACWFQN